MRSLIFTIASLTAAGTASASSIELMTKANIDSSSVSSMSCAACPPLLVEKRVTYIVPELTGGVENVEVKEIDGKTKMFRTDALLGGSPVLFVNSLTPEALAAAQEMNVPGARAIQTADTEDQPPAAIAASQAPVIDGTATTGAVSADATGNPLTVRNSQSQEVDLENTQLRLN